MYKKNKRLGRMPRRNQSSPMTPQEIVEDLGAAYQYLAAAQAALDVRAGYDDEDEAEADFRNSPEGASDDVLFARQIRRARKDIFGVAVAILAPIHPDEMHRWFVDPRDYGIVRSPWD